MKREMKGSIVRETEKYIYTIEVVRYTEDHYFVDFKLDNGRTAWGCTVYYSMEEAEKHINEHENVFFDCKIENRKIRHESCQMQKVMRHRYKKG